ncbi:hypothetical protein BH23GEM3_BH23GEM3_10160 [soil metagenome]
MKRAFLITLGSIFLYAGPLHAGDRIYHGSQHQLAVDIPRVAEATITLDGDLSEPHWAYAAVLTGFTQAEPVEGASASERTEVLIFYTPAALYIGVRAHVSNPSRLRATLAERDKILRDDHIQILLDTFYDRRQAYALYVNPLGIQQDGIHSEGAGRRREERVDFSPDFLFQSRGRVTSEGYTVEIRVPFKSLKYGTADPKSWGINVIRSIAATGAEESWAPLSRGNPSRLAQSGTLVGIRDLRPGTLLELNPTLTGKRDGNLQDGRFQHGGFEPDAGLNLRWGLTSNLMLDATLNPDFSQIEADAGQITTNERFAISFPEKRPFFLEGTEIFATPEPLVYTRTIINPLAGAKLTGKMGGLAIGYLGALDESTLTGGTLSYAPAPQRALFNLVRLQQDIGSGSSVGLLVTDREAGDEYNRVSGVDTRVRFGGVYTLQLQAAGSATRMWVPEEGARDTARIGESIVAVAPRELAGHLLHTSVDRTGRRWGFRLQMKDIPHDFRAQSGFLRRTDVTDFFWAQRLSFFGPPGSVLEGTTTFVTGNRIYTGRSFWAGGEADEGSIGSRTAFSLRGNNRISVGYSNRFFVLDPVRYAAYQFTDSEGVVRTGESAVRPNREMRGLDGFSVDLNSSYFKTVSVGAEAKWEEVPIFAEGTRGEEWSARGELGLRPTDALRVEASLSHSRLFRSESGSLYSRATLPRLRLEYQLTRAIFLRTIGQYNLAETDLLRAPDATVYLLSGEPFRIRRGRFAAADAPQTNPLRMDLLFGYQPSPGTVVFVGYGREMEDREAFRFSPLEPLADGLFVKLSYLFRNG